MSQSLDFNLKIIEIIENFCYFISATGMKRLVA